jgi:hypothetical protein
MLRYVINKADTFIMLNEILNLNNKKIQPKSYGNVGYHSKNLWMCEAGTGQQVPKIHDT